MSTVDCRCGRLDALRAVLASRGLDAWILFNSDPFLSEYIPEHWGGIRWLTGFSGSAGTLVVTADSAALFTDSRYWIQAAAQLEGTGIELVKSGSEEAPSPAQWISDRLSGNCRVGTSFACESAAGLSVLRTELTESGLMLTDTGDLLECIWTEDRPAAPACQIFEHAGDDSRQEKLRAVRSRLRQADAGAVLIAGPDDVAWLTCCRGSDIPYSTVFLARLLITADDAALYIDSRRVPAAVADSLAADGIRLAVPQALSADLKVLSARLPFLLDENRTPADLAGCIVGKPVLGDAPATMLKGIKSANEAARIHEAMRRDGIALAEFFAGLEDKLAAGIPQTESDIVRELHDCRKVQKDFFTESFGTIAAFGPNAALPHYQPDPHNPAPVTDGFLLIDSGAHYLGFGTTDITRTLYVGRPEALTERMKRDYTLVLRGMIDVAMGRYVAGTAGSVIDATARAPLRSDDLDYGHGTGHGVGFVLNVHEGPFHISPRAQVCGERGLQAGRLVSDEPGLYRDGRWGIRIENLVLAVPSDTPDTLIFDTVTLCPIDLTPVITEMLTDAEQSWLNAYHARVRETLMPALSPRAREWLLKKTASL